VCVHVDALALNSGDLACGNRLCEVTSGMLVLLIREYFKRVPTRHVLSRQNSTNATSNGNQPPLKNLVMFELKNDRSINKKTAENGYT